MKKTKKYKFPIDADHHKNRGFKLKQNRKGVVSVKALK